MGKTFKRGWRGGSKDKRSLWKISRTAAASNGLWLPADNFHLWNFGHKIYKACSHLVCAPVLTVLSVFMLQRKENQSSSATCMEDMTTPSFTEACCPGEKGKEGWKKQSFPMITTRPCGMAVHWGSSFFPFCRRNTVDPLHIVGLAHQ